jgi:5-methylcytosine-specific restriction endonuclease McrA
MHGSVLVLNSNFEPLNVCNLKRAIVLVYLGKAEVLRAAEDRALHSTDGVVEPPSVLRLYHQVRRPKPELRLSRRAILARDNYTCQYCGHSSREMTIDHVVPRRLGGGAAWDNLVASCKSCNSRKGDKQPAQAGLALRRKPSKPRFVPYISFTKYLSCLDNEGWREYLPSFPDPRPEAVRLEA